jgi:hypothetical protein
MSKPVKCKKSRSEEAKKRRSEESAGFTATRASFAPSLLRSFASCFLLPASYFLLAFSLALRT